MARVKIDDIVQKISDNTATTASVTVRPRGQTTGGPQLYNASGGTLGAPGDPVTSVGGRIEAWVDEGRYDLVVSGSGFSTYTQEFEAVAPTLTGDISSAKIADSAVTNTKLADNAVINAKLAADAVTTDKIANGTITLADLAASLQAYLVPSGSILATAAGSAPTGYLLCNGTTVSRTTYADLFAAIGTAFNTGGEAATDFRLPNFNGRSPMGTGTSTAAGATNHTLGQQMGEETHQNLATEAAIPDAVTNYASAGTSVQATPRTETPGSAIGTFYGIQYTQGTFSPIGNFSGGEIRVTDPTHRHNITGFNSPNRSNVTHPVTVVNFIIKT